MNAYKNLIEREVTPVNAASVADLVDFERHLCVDRFVVRDDPVVTVPQDERRDHRTGVDEAGEPELLPDPDVDDPISRDDVNLPRNNSDVKLKKTGIFI